ncbi:MAG TPA: response regulator [Parafilimonas sp.]|jgi:DNA-binding NtrC family response regulator|nr:response regulator [Parafilimonas sp.]
MSQTTVQKTDAKKILIIEDEGDMCLILNIMLTGKEMELDHVKNLAAAKEYLDNEQPSVIILDNKLPDGMGVDFISFVKQKHPDVKIVMISGYSDAAKDIALDNGADKFLEKPFTKESLYKSVKELLN